MRNQQQSCNSISATIAVTAALAIAIVLALTVFLTQPAQAQTFRVIYTFTAGADGGSPFGGVIADKAGNLYGTTAIGGYRGGGSCASYGGIGCGTVYKLSHQGSGWTFTALYAFHGNPDGANPSARVFIGPHGGLYGTTNNGGWKVFPRPSRECGTVFNLRPPGTPSSPWTETVLYRFGQIGDGCDPTTADLTFDQAGNIYGTTDDGGRHGGGTVYELVPSDDGWSEKILHSFTPQTDDGGCTWAGVVFDQAGNLYGTTCFGGNLGGACDDYGCGTVFQLTPSGNGWTENRLYSFTGGRDGAFPYGGVIFDQAGNLYGTTLQGGSGRYGGTVFMLSPSDGSWMFTLLYSFTGDGQPAASLVMDGAGNLYGTTSAGGAYGCGTVFKLTRSDEGYTYTLLHDFTGGSDGGNGPESSSNLVLDTNGNLYGTANWGGANGVGVVFEITP